MEAEALAPRHGRRLQLGGLDARPLHQQGLAQVDEAQVPREARLDPSAHQLDVHGGGVLPLRRQQPHLPGPDLRVELMRLDLVVVAVGRQLGNVLRPPLVVLAVLDPVLCHPLRRPEAAAPPLRQHLRHEPHGAELDLEPLPHALLRGAPRRGRPLVHAAPPGLVARTAEARGGDRRVRGCLPHRAADEQDLVRGPRRRGRALRHLVRPLQRRGRWADDRRAAVVLPGDLVEAAGLVGALAAHLLPGLDALGGE
mmetsp:Transcript_39809/g.118033  ORF Transcript_39809/g.118033 Transcript_39809/m.118033 type:complete len:254 (-) Transcript_39809:840-1601(-)